MLSVGLLARRGVLELHILQLPARGVCSAALHRKSRACVTWGSGVASAGHRLPVRRTSGVGGSDAAIDAAGVFGWYGSLADSAPVHLCENFLMSVQQVSGLPWWLSIVTAPLLVRTLITLPLTAYQLVILSKVEALQVEISELAKRLRYEVSIRAKQKGWTDKQSRLQFQKNLRRIISQLYVRDNCHPFKASALVWVQVPLWVSLSVALRNMSLHQSVVYCDLAAGGALWFPDLTSADSTWILPIGVGLINLLTVEVFSLQRQNPTRFQKLMLNFFRGFSVLMVPIAASVPSCLPLYWFISSLTGFSHNLILRSPAIRKLLKVHPGSETPYKDLLSALIHKYHK